MLPYWCLLEILKFMDRDYLERIQVTNRMLNDIVKQDFVTHPLRVFLETMAHVQVKNGEVSLSLRDIHGTKCFDPNIREWNNCNWCTHFYPINVMRPFLCKNVRFSHAYVPICDKNNFSLYAPEHIAPLESISYIWAGKKLFIDEFSDNDSNSLNLILGSSSVLQCRILDFHYFHHRIQILQNPNIYSLYAVKLDFGSINHDEILELVKQKATYPQSDTIFVFDSSKDAIDFALKTVKQNFSTSEDRCHLHFVITTSSSKDIMKFCLNNIRTKEVLELKHISKKQVMDDIDVEIYYEQALLLERYAA